MENLLRRFKCEYRARGQIELVHDAAWTSSKVTYYKDHDGISYEEPEICSYSNVWFRCRECGSPILNKDGERIGSTTEDLKDFLESLKPDMED